MSKIQILAIRRFPDNPEIPDQTVVEIDEDEMREWFLKYLAQDLMNSEQDSQDGYEQDLKAKRFYQKKPMKPTPFSQKQILMFARNGFDAMLAAMKRIAKVRTLP